MMKNNISAMFYTYLWSLLNYEAISEEGMKIHYQKAYNF